MKRLIFILGVMTLFLTSCSILVLEEDSDEYRMLSDQYLEYQLNNLGDIKNFQAFINQVTLESSVASVMVEIKVYSRLGALVDTRYGSGVIFHEDSQNYHVLTDARLTSLQSGQSQVIDISDYLGRNYRGYFQGQSEDGLAGIRFSKVTNRTFKVLDLAFEKPMIGEPVMLIGYQRQIINALTMGLVIDYTDDEFTEMMYMKVNIKSDNFGHGGVIIDTNHHMVGIQFFANDDFILAIPLESITAFYLSYTA